MNEEHKQNIRELVSAFVELFRAAYPATDFQGFKVHDAADRFENKVGELLDAE